jgi:SAM-dependent methyltransferase
MLDRLPLPLFWRSWNARRLGCAFDRQYGTDTQTHVSVSALGIAHELASHAVHYEPSAIPKIKRALRQLRIRHEEYSFIDVGSGKGLVSLLAAGFPFRRVVGVEASQILHETAQRNLEVYCVRCVLRAPVHFVNANALDYEFANGNHVVYLYNPFDAVFLGAYLDRLGPLADSAEVVVVYVNPAHRGVLIARAAGRVLFEDRTLLVCRLSPRGRPRPTSKIA